MHGECTIATTNPVDRPWSPKKLEQPPTLIKSAQEIRHRYSSNGIEASAPGETYLASVSSSSLNMEGIFMCRLSLSSFPTETPEVQSPMPFYRLACAI